jgi:hypothetical protein
MTMIPCIDELAAVEFILPRIFSAKETINEFEGNATSKPMNQAVLSTSLD